jgi:hypothetical protein
LDFNVEDKNLSDFLCKAIASAMVVKSKIAARPSWYVTTTIRASAAALTLSRNAPAVGERLMRRNERTAGSHENESGQKYSNSSNRCALCSADHVADERCRGKDRNQRDLTDSNGVEQLRFSQPMPALNRVRADESNKNIAAPN